MFVFFFHFIFFVYSFISSPRLFFFFTSVQLVLLLFLYLYSCSPSTAPHLSKSLAVKPLSIPLPPGVPELLPRTSYKSCRTPRLSGSFNQILNGGFRAVVFFFCMRILTAFRALCKRNTGTWVFCGDHPIFVRQLHCLLVLYVLTGLFVVFSWLHPPWIRKRNGIVHWWWIFVSV